jgi:hypothetical protein
VELVRRHHISGEPIGSSSGSSAGLSLDSGAARRCCGRTESGESSASPLSTRCRWRGAVGRRRRLHDTVVSLRSVQYPLFRVAAAEVDVDAEFRPGMLVLASVGSGDVSVADAAPG